MTWSLERKIIIGFGSALLILSFTGWITYRSMINCQEDAGWVQHTHQVVHSLETLLSSIKDAESNRRGFLLTQDRSYVEQYRHVLVEIRKEFERLPTLTLDSKYQQQKIEILKPLITRKLKSLDDSIHLHEMEPSNLGKQILVAEVGKA